MNPTDPRIGLLRRRFAPLESRPVNVLIKAGFTSKEDVAAAIRRGDFVCGDRRVWTRRSENHPYVQVRGCGVRIYETIARWADVEPHFKSAYKTRHLYRHCTPAQRVLRVQAVRKAAELLRSQPATSEEARKEEEAVIEALIYQAGMLEKSERTVPPFLAVPKNAGT